MAGEIKGGAGGAGARADGGQGGKQRAEEPPSTPIKLAINWAAACGGCDVEILDLEAAVLEVAKLVEFVYWPVAMDFKRAELRAMPPGSIDIGIFNGAVRTSEQEEDARLLRERCRTLVAFGACACFGGIPALANVASRDGVLQTVYADTASTDNPDGVRPGASGSESDWGGLPELEERVRPLHQVVDVDLFVPGCPPPLDRVKDLVAAVEGAARGEPLPPAGAFLAFDRSLCEECPREARDRQRQIPRFVRVHQVEPGSLAPDACLLDQGVACAGVATRGGCGATCLAVDMPCRGCMGPLPGQLDPAAELTSALAVLPGPRGNWELPVHQIVSPARSIPDPLGTFYRFSYAVSPGRRTLDPRDGERGGQDG
jgi:F420-non-reducing hydrogenase small subunit